MLVPSLWWSFWCNYRVFCRSESLITFLYFHFRCVGIQDPDFFRHVSIIAPQTIVVVAWTARSHPLLSQQEVRQRVSVNHSHDCLSEKWRLHADILGRMAQTNPRGVLDYLRLNTLMPAWLDKPVIKTSDGLCSLCIYVAGVKGERRTFLRATISFLLEVTFFSRQTCALRSWHIVANGWLCDVGNSWGAREGEQIALRCVTL